MSVMRVFGTCLVAALLFLSGLELSLAELPPPISISNPPVFRPRTPAEIKTIEDAMAAVITVTSKDLGLPVVEPLYIHLHKDTNAFAAHAGSYGRRLSASTVQFAVAVADANRFHINMERTRGRPWGALIRTLAHEYAHNVENVFSSVYRGSQWIREGFADWVATKVLHSLGWQDYANSVHRAKLEVGRQRASLPTLSDLDESRGWNVWANNPSGPILTYRVAFLAVDKLMSRAGVPEMQKYFATSDFQTQFGLSWSEFEREFKASIARAKTVARSAERTDKPEWKAGHQWHYAWKAPGRRGALVREMVREEVFEGQPTYVVRTGDNENFYAKESLGLLVSAAKGKNVTRRSSPNQYFSWPLEDGKEWQNAFVRENLGQKSSQKLSFQMVVSAVEEVTVPAGAFDAFKIETYEAHNGTLVSEYWYAPKAKWFVKSRDYVAEGVREEELTRYTVE